MKQYELDVSIVLWCGIGTTYFRLIFVNGNLIIVVVHESLISCIVTDIITYQRQAPSHQQQKLSLFLSLRVLKNIFDFGCLTASCLLIL